MVGRIWGFTHLECRFWAPEGNCISQTKKRPGSLAISRFFTPEMREWKCLLHEKRCRLSITFTSLSFRFRLPCIHNCTRKVRMEKSTWLYRLLRNRGFLSAERAKCYTDFSAQNCWRCRPFLKSRYNTKVGITTSIKENK